MPRKKPTAVELEAEPTLDIRIRVRATIADMIRQPTATRVAAAHQVIDEYAVYFRETKLKEVEELYGYNHGHLQEALPLDDEDTDTAEGETPISFSLGPAERV